MDYKEEINKRGLKVKWVASQVGIARSTLSQYINNLKGMPAHIDAKLKELFK